MQSAVAEFQIFVVSTNVVGDHNINCGNCILLVKHLRTC